MPYISASTIQSEILQYLSNHPDAEDTLDEIGRWWLQRKIQIAPQRLKLVIAELVRDGAVCERETNRGPVYGLIQRTESPRKTSPR